MKNMIEVDKVLCIKNYHNIYTSILLYDCIKKCIKAKCQKALPTTSDLLCYWKHQNLTTSLKFTRICSLLKLVSAIRNGIHWKLKIYTGMKIFRRSPIFWFFIFIKSSFFSAFIKNVFIIFLHRIFLTIFANKML